MKIDHIAIYTDNLEGLKTFYEKYFNAISNSLYHNANTGLKTYFLTFECGSRLELMSRPELESSNKSLIKRGLIHIAFSTGSNENVDNLTKKLEIDGYQIISHPRRTGDGYYESTILDPDGNQIEITA